MPGTAAIEDAEALDAPDSPGTMAPPGRRGFSGVVTAYSAFLALLIPVFLWIGRTSWFAFDDWDYLVTRKAGSLDDLLRPHNGHWEAIPVIIYRGLFALFGLRYLPFQLVSIAASLVAADLLLVLMLRARTRPWIAVLVATLFVLFGDAQYNVALQITSITFIGFAVPLGLAQLMLADHKGSLNRRDWIGLGLALIALLCSSVATVMILAVGIAMLIKRGWRIALFHVGLPLVIFSTWFLGESHNDTTADNPGKLHFTARAVHFAWSLVTGTLESLTRSNGVGTVLLILFLVSLGLVVWHAGPEQRQDAVIPGVLLAAGAFFAFEIGLGRADLLPERESYVRQGHYLAVVAALMLPAVAFLAEEVVRRWRALARRNMLLRNSVLLIPRLSLAHDVPPRTAPFLGTASPITVQWLLDMTREGRVPRLHTVTPAARAIATMRISLIARGTARSRCRSFKTAVTLQMAKGAEFHFRGAGVQVRYIDGGRQIATTSFLVPKQPPEWKLLNQGGPLRVRLSPAVSKARRPMICD